MKVRVAFAASALALACPALAAPPPASAFGRLPGIQQAAISPNGQSVAMLGGPPGGRSISFAVIDKPGLPSLDLGSVKAVSIRWAGDDFLLTRVAVWDHTNAKNTYRLERNISVTPDGKPVARLLEQDDLSQQLIQQPVLGVTAGPRPSAMVLGLQFASGPAAGNDTRLKRKGEEDDRVMALWRVDPATGKGTLAERGDWDTRTWDLDLAGEARTRVDVDGVNHKFSLMGRPKGSKQWNKLIVDVPEDEGWETYSGYSDPDDAVYLAQAAPGGTQLVRRSLATGETTPVGQPVAGGLSLLWDEARVTVVGLAPSTGGAPEWLDPGLASVHGALSRVFKGKTVDLASWSSDRARFVVRVTGVDTPATWYLFDKPAKSLSPLGDEYPELKDAALGVTSMIRYKARDGLDIPAYLTLPPGETRTTGARLPLIVLAHDGPDDHDAPNFDWLTQYLATRGYAVLRPQFRGSTGYGRDFELAGRGEWGGKIQTDLLDGIAHLAANQQIDPARVCVAGISFGGYSALAGAALHPEAYRCAVSVAGFSDVGVLIGDNRRKFQPDSAIVRSLRRQLGDPNSDGLNAISPLKQVAQVRAPILLIHGDQDGVVPIEQSRLMDEALRKAGRPDQLVVLAGEGHDLLNPGSRTQMLEALGDFLVRNLPVTP